MFTVKQGLGLSSGSSSSAIEEKVEQQQQQRPWWMQRQRSVIGFASVGAAAGGGGLSAAAFSFAPPLPRGKKESRTGTSFPADFCHVMKKACPVLTGVG